MAALIEQAKAFARIALYVFLAFLAISLWQDPHGAAQATMDFINGIGHFFATLFDKIGEFISGLGGSDAPATPGSTP